MAETETQESFPLLSYILHKVNPSSHSPPPQTQLQDLMKLYPLLQNSKLVSSLANNIPITAAQSYTMLVSKTMEFGDGEVERMTGELKQVEDKLVLAYGCAMDEFESKEEENEEEGGGVDRVDLSGRELSVFPDKIGRFLGLVVLNLSGNQFKAIPDTITGLQKLEELDVSSNLLESLPDSIGLLLNLRVLNVSGNKLIALPQSICLCSSLVELDASFNNLRSLPAKIGYNLGKLERLFLHLNKISSLPPSLGEMNSLRYLDIHFNELRSVPNAIGRLTNLEVLNLSSNFSDLTELPETIGDLINLRELDLSNNQLRTLPSTFHWLVNLTTLNLEENPLEFPPMDVVREGVKAIKDYMSKMWDDRIAEEHNMILEANQQEPQDGWLAWGSSLLSNIVSRVSPSMPGYHGSGKETTKSSWLDQQL